MMIQGLPRDDGRIDGSPKDTRKLPGVMDTFTTLIGVMVKVINYTFKYLQFGVCQLPLNKTVRKNTRNTKKGIK